MSFSSAFIVCGDVILVILFLNLILVFDLAFFLIDRQEIDLLI